MWLLLKNDGAPRRLVHLNHIEQIAVKPAPMGRGHYRVIASAHVANNGKPVETEFVLFKGLNKLEATRAVDQLAMHMGFRAPILPANDDAELVLPVTMVEMPDR